MPVPGPASRGTRPRANRAAGRRGTGTVGLREWEPRHLGGDRPVSRKRTAQLAYSELQAAMLDEDKRRRKAAKIIAVLAHFLGREKADRGEILAGLTVGDIGCSAGFIADELAAAGASRTFGADIDVPGLKN